MRACYKKILESALSEPEISARYNYLQSIIRSLLHVCAIVSIELYVKKGLPDDDSDLNADLTKLHSPSDGDTREILDKLIPRIRSSFWSGFATGWFETKCHSDASEAATLSQELLEWVEFRNDRPAHGVSDDPNVRIWTQRMEGIARRCLCDLADALPTITVRGEVLLNTPVGDMSITTPLTFNDAPIVIRRFTCKRGLWFLVAQPLDFKSAPNTNLSVPAVAPTVQFAKGKFEKFTPRKIVYDGSVEHIFANVPLRESYIFEGREKERQDLLDWLHDHESRACLVYGDGGLGKTTLVLEVLNSLLDDDLTLVAEPPELISYYSAKKTRWTAEGIKHLTGTSGAVEDALRELPLIFESSLSKEWYKTQGRQLIDRMATYLRDAGLKRDEILLVLDNLETMDRNPEQRDEFEKLIDQISRKVARVIMTSRRREKIEARPIELLPMPEDDALRLIRILGKDNNADAINRAGDATLRKYLKKLNFKPLYIDVFVRRLGATGTGLEQAFEAVVQASEEGLSEFLYEDAWLRIEESHRCVFLALANIDTPLDDHTVGWVCRYLEVPHSEWLERGFYLTRFGTLQDFGSHYELEFELFACGFFKLKYQALTSDQRQRIKAVCARVEDLASRAHRAQSEYFGDRVHEAFRTASARAAKVAAARGDISEAIEWYEEAVKEDAHNTHLFDRFAWLMLTKVRDYDRALILATRALEIDRENSEAALIMGLVYFRVGDLENGDKWIARAVELGKPKGLGLLQKGIARFHRHRAVSSLEDKVRLLNESLRFLKSARQSIEETDPFGIKNIKDADDYIVRAQEALTTLRSKSLR